MKKVQTVFALLLLAAISAVAQTPCAPHPTDRLAALVGSYTVTVDIAQTASVSKKSGKKGEKCTVAQLICVWRTGGGTIDLIGDPATVKMTGTCMTDLPATDLFQMLGRAAVAKGVSLGFVGCATNCTGQAAVRYLTVTCVSRSGSGTTTKFGHCTDVQCVRSYTVCCPNGPGAPRIDRAPADNAGCGATPAGCQSACDQNCPPAPMVQ